jgi:hypothetical protein
MAFEPVNNSTKVVQQRTTQQSVDAIIRRNNELSREVKVLREALKMTALRTDIAILRAEIKAERARRTR